MSNGYIFTRVYINWKLEFPIYLHNLIMNQIKFTSDKTGKSVDHINRIPLTTAKKISDLSIKLIKILIKPQSQNS